MTRAAVARRASYTLTDLFDTDGAIGSPWTDGHSVAPQSWEPLGVRDGAAVIWQDRTRTGTYQADQWNHPPSPGGTLYSAIGCAYVDTGSSMPDITVRWNGHAQIPTVHGTANSHVEGTPLLYVDPTNPLGGFGVWPAWAAGQAVWFAGYIGSPAEHFTTVAVGSFTSHVEGQPCDIRLVAVAPGRVLLYLDGVQQPLTSLAAPSGNLSPVIGGVRGDYDPIPVDPSLITSTKHGFALDGHIVYPTANVTTTPGIYSIEMTCHP